MSYMTILLRTITLACAIVCFLALTQKADAQKADAQTSPLSAEKVQAKQDAVAAHAARKRACKAEAKKRGLHLKKRRAFLKDCIAKR